MRSKQSARTHEKIRSVTFASAVPSEAAGSNLRTPDCWQPEMKADPPATSASRAICAFCYIVTSTPFLPLLMPTGAQRTRTCLLLHLQTLEQFGRKPAQPTSGNSPNISTRSHTSPHRLIVSTHNLQIDCCLLLLRTGGLAKNKCISSPKSRRPCAACIRWGHVRNGSQVTAAGMQPAR